MTPVGSFGGVSADAYARFMGRFSTPLAVEFATVGLEGQDAARLEAALRDELGDGAFTVTARAWAAVGTPA
jgi:hypothetical protein